MTETEWLQSTDAPVMLAKVLHGSAQRIGRYWLLTSDRQSRLFAVAIARRHHPDFTLWRDDAAPKRLTLLAERAVEAGQPNHNFNDREARDVGAWWGVCRAEEAAISCARLCIHPDDQAKAGLLRDIIGNPFASLPLWRNQSQPGLGPIGNHRIDWVTPDVLALARSAYNERPGSRCPERCVVLPNPPVTLTGRYLRWAEGRGWHACTTCHGTGRIDDGTLDNVTLSILADALADGGCDYGPLLTHLRGTIREYNDGGTAYWYSDADPGAHHLTPDRAAPRHVRGCWAVDLILGKS